MFFLGDMKLGKLFEGRNAQLVLLLASSGSEKHLLGLIHVGGRFCGGWAAMLGIRPKRDFPNSKTELKATRICLQAKKR